MTRYLADVWPSRVCLLSMQWGRSLFGHHCLFALVKCCFSFLGWFCHYNDSSYQLFSSSHILNVFPGFRHSTNNKHEFFFTVYLKFTTHHANGYQTIKRQQRNFTVDVFRFRENIFRVLCLQCRCELLREHLIFMLERISLEFSVAVFN